MANNDIIGGWNIGEFHHDPTDDSHFWIETHIKNGNERLAHTGAHREGLHINGQELFPPHAFHMPAEPDRAKEHYLEIGKHLMKLINRKLDN